MASNEELLDTIAKLQTQIETEILFLGLKGADCLSWGTQSHIHSLVLRKVQDTLGENWSVRIGKVDNGIINVQIIPPLEKIVLELKI